MEDNTAIEIQDDLSISRNPFSVLPSEVCVVHTSFLLLFIESIKKIMIQFFQCIFTYIDARRNIFISGTQTSSETANGQPFLEICGRQLLRNLLVCDEHELEQC